MEKSRFPSLSTWELYYICRASDIMYMDIADPNSKECAKSLFVEISKNPTVRESVRYAIAKSQVASYAKATLKDGKLIFN